MSTIKANNLQVGQSLTSTNNFVWYQPASPDGTVRLGNGNSGSVTDVLVVNSSGSLSLNNASFLQFKNSSGTTMNMLGVNASDNLIYGSSGAFAGNHIWYSAGERMRLDTSGNLGLGVTPSAWRSTQSVIQLGQNASFNSYSGLTTAIGSNYYINSGAAPTYIQASKYALSYTQRPDTGHHYWQVAPVAGAAGDPITFTQTMTLDTSGNLGIGSSATTPAARLNVVISGTSGIGTTIAAFGSPANQSRLVIKDEDASYGPTILSNAGNPLFILGGTGGTGGSLALGTNGSEKIRIDQNGNTMIGTTTQATGALLTVNGSIKGTITSGTAVSASGTSVDFTGIPSWAKRITVMFSGVSLSGTSEYLIQIGAGSVTTTGYTSAAVTTQSTASSSAAATSTSGFLASQTIANAAYLVNGTIDILNVSSNSWISKGLLVNTTGARACHTAGSVTLSGTLDRIRITTVNGTDTFDAGTINILYEG